MKIPLDKFEHIINETILERGLSYFKKGYVTEFSEISNGKYEALVTGTEEYTVQIGINNNIITEHNCNCPYDFGSVCKHIVAVIFYLQQDLLDLEQSNISKPKKKRTKSVSQQVKELLKAISYEELVEFVQENSEKDRKFRNYFLASFGHLSETQSKEFYQKQINSILKIAVDRDGWIGWSDMKYVVNAIEPFLTNADKYFENSNFENVFYISAALLEEMIEALQYGDDSNGDLGYFIDSSMEMLFKMATEKLNDSFKIKLFEYCINTFKKGLFIGWDWHLGMLDIACELIEEENEADIILTCLDTVQGQYEIEQAQSFKLNLIRKFKDEKEVGKYINQHISNKSIRRDEILKALMVSEFERAIELSKDGIKCDEKDKPGLVKEWYNWLLKIAQAQNDITKVIEYSRFLLIDNFSEEQDYYQILKDSIDDKNWHPFLEEIIKEITPKTRWTYIELIRNIYIKEEWWDKLFLMLKQNVSLNNIEQNEKFLFKNYAPELIELYSEQIVAYVEKNVGRNHYQLACRYLRRMKKLGGNNQVNNLIENFRKKYPQRRALMDELNRV